MLSTLCKNKSVLYFFKHWQLKKMFGLDGFAEKLILPNNNNKKTETRKIQSYFDLKKLKIY